MNANHNSLCWRPDWQVPFESLWSLLKKFGYLNAAAYPDIRDLIRRPAPEKATTQGTKVRRDLNTLSPIDDEKLKRFLLIDPIVLCQSTALAYIRPHEITALTSNQLRYCVQCIKAGFHSAIHQLLFVSHCPIHLTPLVTRCKECGTISPRYALSSLSYRPGLKCNRCFDALVDNFVLSSQPNDPAKSRELECLAAWLQGRNSARWAENYMFAGSFFRSRSKCRHKKLLRLPRYWCEPLPFPVDKPLPRLPERERHHSVTTSAHMRTNPALVDEIGQLTPDFKKELTCDFRAISRNLLHCVLRPHKPCIRALKRHVCWIVPTRYWPGRICVAANAFLLWLMRCQNIDDPMQLFQQDTRLRFHPPETFVQNDMTLSRAVFRRITALNWSSLFYEALLVSYGLNRKGLYSLCPALVEGVRRPHWLVEWPSNESQILHWWMQNRFTDRIVSDKKLCPGPSTPRNKWRTQQCSCLT